MPNITITVTSGEGEKTVPSTAVVLSNEDRTINRIGFTDESGVCLFVGVGSGMYSILVLECGTQHSLVISQKIGDSDPHLDVRLKDYRARGRMMVIVKVGSTNTRSGIKVNLYNAGVPGPIATQFTDDNGEVNFGPIFGMFDVEAIGKDPSVCRDFKQDIVIPVDDDVVPIELNLPANC